LDKEVSLICKELAEWLAGPTTAVSDAAKVVSSVLVRINSVFLFFFHAISAGEIAKVCA